MIPHPPHGCGLGRGGRNRWYTVWGSFNEGSELSAVRASALGKPPGSTRSGVGARMPHWKSPVGEDHDGQSDNSPAPSHGSAARNIGAKMGNPERVPKTDASSP
ncbi:hypothetical protein LEMLEM_LOCUS576 [Lemmus lemmus]